MEEKHKKGTVQKSNDMARPSDITQTDRKNKENNEQHEHVDHDSLRTEHYHVIWLIGTKYTFFKCNVSFAFYVNIFFSLSATRLDLTIWIIRWVSCKKQEFIISWEHLGSPVVFDGVHVAHLHSFLCYDFYFVFLCSFTYGQCCMCLWNVHSWLHFRFSLTFVHSWLHLRVSLTFVHSWLHLRVSLTFA